MIILGIDPGLSNIGWGIIECKNSRYKYIADGSITTDSKVNLASRLYLINNKINEVIEKYNPECASIESIFFAKNKKTAIIVSQARGAILLTLALKNLDFYEYTPIQIKNAVSGFGRIGKDGVEYMVKILLNIDFPLASNHSVDALAIAISHAQYKGGM